MMSSKGSSTSEPRLASKRFLDALEEHCPNPKNSPVLCVANVSGLASTSINQW
jgi:hypothetical protein